MVPRSEHLWALMCQWPLEELLAELLLGEMAPKDGHLIIMSWMLLMF